MNEVIRIAVIGVGSMGNNHARILSDMPGVELVAIVDMDEARAKLLARRYHTQAYTNPRDLFAHEQLYAVSVCVPTAHHHEVALQAIEHKVNVLVEKPIAISIAHGHEMILAAKQADVIFSVGHVERFNPAVIDLRQRIARGELGQIFQIEAHRASPFPMHVKDVGVVVDLAVHDLDVMRYITESEVQRVYAEVGHRVHATHEDQLLGILRFTNGVIGKITVNWLTPSKIRDLTVIGERGMFVVNYITQDLTFYENAATQSTDWATLGILRGVNEGSMTRYFVPKKEPLRAELETFIEAVRNNSRPLVSGEDGVKALALAESLLQSGREHQSISLML